MIDIKSKCGEIFHADEKFLGKKIRCPKCGEILTIQVSEVQKGKTSEPTKSTPFTFKPKSQRTNYSQPRKFKDLVRQATPILILLLIVSAIIVISKFPLEKNISSDPSSTLPHNPNNSEISKNRPETGNLYKENINTSSASKEENQTPIPKLNKTKPLTIRPPLTYEQNKLAPRKIFAVPIDPYASWNKPNLRTGDIPCYNFKPTYDYAIDNKLEVKVGANTDVAIKLYSYTTDECIRYIYIRSGETYNIKNIPQDRYYTKIAYGTDWRDTIANGQCIGIFHKNGLYKKGAEVLDFHKEYMGKTYEGDYETTHYTIPSFSILLDVVFSEFDSKNYQTNSISEEEFNR